MIPCHSIWDLWSNLVWVNLIHLASSSWLTIPSAFSSILFQMVHFRILELGINLHQGDIITCPRWPPISFDSPQDWVHQTPPPGPRQGTPRGHSRGRGRRGAGWNQVEVVRVWSPTYFFSGERFSMKDPVMLLFMLQRWSTLNLKISFTYFVIEQITVNNNGHPMNSWASWNREALNKKGLQPQPGYLHEEQTAYRGKDNPRKAHCWALKSRDVLNW